MNKKELLLQESGNYIKPTNGILRITGNLLLNEDLWVNGNVEVAGSVSGEGTLYATGTISVDGTEGNTKEKASLPECDLSIDDGTVYFHEDVTFENGIINIMPDRATYGIENNADFTVYCSIISMAVSRGLQNTGVFIVEGDGSAEFDATTSSAGYGIDNTGTIIIENDGYVKATSEGSNGRGINNSGTIAAIGALAVVGVSYGIYNTGSFSIGSSGSVETESTSTGSSASGFYNADALAELVVDGTLTTTGSAYGIYNKGTAIIDSVGSIDATGGTRAVYNSSGTITINGTLTATATGSSGYGVYNSSGTVVLDGTCYVIVSSTSSATYGTLEGNGTLYVNGEETPF